MPRETYKDYANEIYEKVKAAEAEKEGPRWPDGTAPAG